MMRKTSKARKMGEEKERKQAKGGSKDQKDTGKTSYQQAGG